LDNEHVEERLQTDVTNILTKIHSLNSVANER